MTEDRLGCFQKNTYYAGGGFIEDFTYEFNPYDCQIRCQKNKALLTIHKWYHYHFTDVWELQNFKSHD